MKTNRNSHLSKPSLSAFVCLSLFFAGSNAIAIDPSCDLNLSSSNHESSTGEPLANAGKSNELLMKEIKTHLKHKLPQELLGCQSNKERAWYEFLRGLAKIESDGKCSTHGDKGHFGGKGSKGIFQMTQGDYCGTSTLKDPTSGEENVRCTVQIWKRPDYVRIQGNKYWGPCKRWESKCQHIVNTVKDRVCNGSSKAIDWHQVFATQGGSNQGHAGGTE